MKKPYFKYIIIGAGTSGLHLIKSISEDKFFRKEKILLIDKSLKKMKKNATRFGKKVKVNGIKLLQNHGQMGILSAKIM